MTRLLIFFLLLIANSLIAQQDRFHWRVGAQTGVMSYFGDLNSRLMPANQSLIDKEASFLSYGLSLEKSVNQSSLFRISVSRGQFIANDRAINFKGQFVDSEFFARSLNVKTELKDISLHYIWYTDNDRLLSKQAFLSPYFGIGLGLSKFETFGDLFQNNTRYHYWSDGTIRDAAESTGNGIVVEQDGLFETNLTNLETEKEAYATQIWFGSALFGLKLRLNSRINVNIEYKWNYTTTDYLDDVSGDFQTFDNAYASYVANPANYSGKRGNSGKMNDSYAFTSISMYYNLGKRKTPFKAPELITAQASSDKTFSIEKEKEIALGARVSKKSDLVSPTIDLSHYSPLLGFLYFDSLGNLVNALDPSSTFLADGGNGAEGGTNSSVIVEDSLPNKNDINALATNILTNDLAADKDSLPVVSETKDSNVFSVMPVAKKDSLILIVNDLDNDTSLAKEELAEEKAITTQPVTNTTTEVKAVGLATDSLNTAMQHELIALRAQMDLLIKLQGGIPNSFQDTTQLLANPDTLNRDTLTQQKAIIEQPVLSNNNQLALLMLQNQLAQINQRIDALAKGQNESAKAESDHKMMMLLVDEIKDLKSKIQLLEKAELAAKSLAISGSKPIENKNTSLELFQKTVIYFDTNAFELSPSDKTKLDTLLEYVKTNSFSVVIRGYTDQVGNAKYNEQLAMKRATAVRQYLHSKGLAENRLLIDHVGPDTNISTQKASYGRRVELLLR